MIIDKPLYYPQPGLYSALEFYTVIITNQTKLTVLSILLNYLKWHISYPLNQLFHGFTIKSLENMRKNHLKGKTIYCDYTSKEKKVGVINCR